ncbi:MAG: glycoside hydrolase family 2 TIM barrel-domain containing protein [Kiritimatiellia bacterium]
MWFDAVMDLKDYRELEPECWVPVPNEGWGIEAASADNPSAQLLNGTWDFAIRDRDPSECWFRIRDNSWWRWDAGREALVEGGGPRREHEYDSLFFQRDSGDMPWREIPVPSNWESHAFSQQVFAHCSLDKDDKVGYYRRGFRLPGEWIDDGGRIILQAEGIAASAEVYVNERYIGYRDGGFIPFQLDITDAVTRDGDNLLAIRVVKGDISTVHDNSGQWMLSGIWRDIFIFHVSETHVSDLRVQPDYDAGSGTGRLEIDVQAHTAGGEHAIEAKLYEWAADSEVVSEYVDVEQVSGSHTELCLETDAIKPWSPEAPVMYRLELRLLSDGTVVERVREEVGFRRFEADGERFLLNGKPFLIRGVTRHEIKQGRGRSLSVADMLNEIRLMREANITGVRSHPYPFDPRWIRLCARHGILVCSGFCLCGYNSWGNPWAISEIPTYPEHEEDIDPGYRELFRDRYHAFAPRIFGRLKNMTAVFAWSLANESAISRIFVPVARFLHEQERGRFIISAGDRCIAESRFGGRHPELREAVDYVRWECMTADSQHYPERCRREEFPSTVPWNPEHPRPMFYTESAHPFCNRDNYIIDPSMQGDLYGAGLKRTFEIIRTMSGVGGYFIFEWCDQSVMQKGDPELCDSFIRPWHGYVSFNQNVKGILGPNHEYKPAYHSVRKTYARVVIEEVSQNARELVLRIRNDYTFIDLESLAFTLTPVRGSTPVGAVEEFSVQTAPGRTAEVRLSTTPAAGMAAWRIAVFEAPWEGPVAERDINVGDSVRLSPPGTGGSVDIGCFASPSDYRVSLGTAGLLGAQAYVGMGHISAGNLPPGFITLDDIEHWETVDSDDMTLHIRARVSQGRGFIDSRIGVTESDGVLSLEQELWREGEQTWVSGTGMSFMVPAAYREIGWRRRSGVWTEYPPDHPDRLVGRELLGRDEYPPAFVFGASAGAQRGPCMVVGRSCSHAGD